MPLASWADSKRGKDLQKRDYMIPSGYSSSESSGSPLHSPRGVALYQRESAHGGSGDGGERWRNETVDYWRGEEEGKEMDESADYSVPYRSPR